MPTPEEAVEELIVSRPRIHWTEEDWGLSSQAMGWLAEHVQPGWRTVETGCGQSSILFALKGASHTIVAPAEWEHENVRAWCQERGFSTDNVTSVVDHSQRALPQLTRDGHDPLDLALIDGAHAFPFPWIDFYYLAEPLRVGGYLMIDDTQLRTGALLRDFLTAEEGRWELVADFGTTVVFRKTSDVLVPDTDWVGQPWCADWADPREAKAAPPLSPLDRLRIAVRLRTRLRALARRLRGG